MRVTQLESTEPTNLCYRPVDTHATGLCFLVTTCLYLFTYLLSCAALPCTAGIDTDTTSKGTLPRTARYPSCSMTSPKSQSGSSVGEGGFLDQYNNSQSSWVLHPSWVDQVLKRIL
jgi:hypothetical protein